MKALLATGSIFALATIGFYSVPGASGLASVITGVNTSVEECLTEIALSKKNGVIESYEVVRERIDTDSTKDIIIQDTSADACGSVGCIYEICLVSDGEVTRNPFGFAAEDFIVMDTITNNRHDIQLQGKSTLNFKWDGDRYIAEN